jgi:potassium efflux system protein
MPFQHSVLRWLLMMLSLAWAGVPLAQETPPAQPPEVATVESDEIAIIPVADISIRATEDDNRLRQFRTEIQSDDDIATVQDALLETIDLLQQLSATTDLAEVDSFNLAALARLRDSWQPYRTQFEVWQATVQERVQAMEEIAGELQGMREVWEPTFTSSAQELPEPLVDHITTLLTVLAEGAAEQQTHMDDLLTLQDQLLRERANVDIVLERITAADTLARQQRFTLDSDPLWTALRISETYVSPAQDMVNSWNLWIEDLNTLRRESRYRMRFQAGIFGMLVLLILLLRRNRPSESGDETPDPAVRVLSRPISAALLITLVASRWTYSDLPESIVGLLILAVLVPMVRLLPLVITQASRVGSIGLVALFLLDRITALTLEQTLLHRLLLLTVTVLGCVLMLWAIRPGGAAKRQRDSGWLRLSIHAGRGAVILLFVSALVNLAGMVALSRLLTGATLTSIYVAVVFLGGVAVITSILELALRSQTAKATRVIARHAADIRRIASTVIPLAAFLAWFRIVLILFDIYQPLASGFTAILARRWVWGTFEISLGNLLAFLVALGITILASRFIPAVLQKDVFSRTKIPYGARGAIELFVRYGILFIGFLIAIATAGIQLSQFALIAGALGVGIGFGLQNLVSNFISGTVLAFERPISIGDTIQVGTLYGIVQRIGLRTSIVRARDGSEVILPNSTLTSSEVVNWTLSDMRRRVELSVGTAYGTDPRVVIEILQRIAHEHPKVRSQPEAEALFLGFGESSLDFLLRFWITDPVGWRVVHSEVALSVHDAFRDAGIVIPFPQRDLHLRTVDETGRSLLGEDPKHPQSTPKP